MAFLSIFSQGAVNNMAETIGFIGVGTMGGAMAANLVKAGHGVLAYDTNPTQLEKAKSQGMQSAESIAQVATQCQVVFSCLPNDDAVTSTYLGEQGLLVKGLEGRVTCDFSTVSPQTAQSIAQAASALQKVHVEAPMLGSKPQAQSGEVFLIVGGQPAEVDKIAPLLKVMCRKWLVVGQCGMGAKIKLLHNAVGAFNYTAVAQALGMCVASDVSLQTFYEVVCKGGGMAYGNYFQRKVPSIIQQDFSPRFQLALAAKDGRLAEALIQTAGVEAPLLEEGRKYLNEALAEGWGEEDASVVTRLVEKQLGKPILHQP